ncbi:MAG: iron-sulfur protein [Sphaerobacteraceae bacterium]|nr:MAG: iron-sulfur protein [Sphaerobacteraceae bacterium]
MRSGVFPAQLLRSSCSRSVVTQWKDAVMESARAIKQVVRDAENQEWVHDLTNKMEENVVEAYDQLGEVQWPIRNVLHGSFMGHPLHATVTDVPTGAWATAFVLDAADVLFDQKQLAPGADAAIAVGLAGASVASASGWADWKHTKGSTQRTGLIHGLLNGAATGFYLTSFILRKIGLRGPAQILSTIGFGLTIAGSYLGGELVFDRLVGVNRAEPSEEPAEFTPIASVDDLEEGKPYRFEVNQVPVVVVKSNGTFHALSDICSHLGRPLSGGEVHDGCITCPAHGSTFKLENGAVVTGPTAYSQPTFDTRVNDGYLEIRSRHVAD